jgi:hypothetical protein
MVMSATDSVMATVRDLNKPMLDVMTKALPALLRETGPEFSRDVASG